MVHIITGPINSGKSTRLALIYNNMQCGDGFYNRKVYKDCIYIGQDLVQLSTEISVPFSRLVDHLPKDWKEFDRYKNFSFSLSGIAFADNIFKSILTKNTNPAFIDEIGPLELNCGGFYNNFNKLHLKNHIIYVVVRDYCFNDAILKFGINDYKII